MNIRPLQDRIVVKRLDSEKTTAGGIVLPDSSKEKPQKAEVLAVGPGKTLKNGDKRGLDVQVGDIILFSKYAGTEVKESGEELLIIREDDVLAVIGS